MPTPITDPCKDCGLPMAISINTGRQFCWRCLFAQYRGVGTTTVVVDQTPRNFAPLGPPKDGDK